MRCPVGRFLLKVHVRDDGCWQWDGAMYTSGYACFWSGEKRVRAHRWAYEQWIGRIPAGLVADHLCRNRACVNPAHLEAVTNSVNVLRGDRHTRIPRRTHCKHGHPFSGDNLYVSRGVQRCRECGRRQARKDYYAHQEQRQAASLRRYHANRGA